jgi:hypothetical protein
MGVIVCVWFSLCGAAKCQEGYFRTPSVGKRVFEKKTLGGAELKAFESARRPRPYGNPIQAWFPRPDFLRSRALSLDTFTMQVCVPQKTYSSNPLCSCVKCVQGRHRGLLLHAPSVGATPCGCPYMFCVARFEPSANA